jgi:hypothetical protein
MVALGGGSQGFAYFLHYQSQYYEGFAGEGLPVLHGGVLVPQRLDSVS